MDDNKATHYEIHMVPPESLNVGKLNQAVKSLREEIYQLKIKLAKAKDIMSSANGQIEAI